MCQADFLQDLHFPGRPSQQMSRINHDRASVAGSQASKRSRSLFLTFGRVLAAKLQLGENAFGKSHRQHCSEGGTQLQDELECWHQLTLQVIHPGLAHLSGRISSEHGRTG
eukprot:4749946-Amphidinium_carterae.1